MGKEYVTQKDGAYLIVESRVSLDSVVYAFRRGASAESINHSFPSLTLEQIYGAITFYLANQECIDAYLAEGESEFENLRADSRLAHADWYERMEQARQEMLAHQS
ncbi:MAG: DUF433 domain-containing protein [Pyrinomonadaceae bacterium MAG19_C2-C3]|nr:DUF433 domain-containing protein [Pyrinomonadaceae bacterium MAG19_C2-C3]